MKSITSTIVKITVKILLPFILRYDVGYKAYSQFSFVRQKHKRMFAIAKIQFAFLWVIISVLGGLTSIPPTQEGTGHRSPTRDEWVVMSREGSSSCISPHV